MGEVIVVTGPPGAGKSAVAEFLTNLFDPSALVAGDEFFGFLRNGAISPWLPEAHPQNAAVIEAAAAATGRLAAQSDVVYDGVVGPWFLTAFLSAAGLDLLHYVVLLPPLDVCLDRVSLRPAHGFTDRGAAKHMWDEFDQAPVDPRHVIRDHRKPPAEIALSLAKRVEDGTIRYPR